MLMNSPLPRGGLGTLRESTTMRSIRDRDSVGNAWKTTNTNAAQLAAVVETVNRQGRTINKLRRRVPTLIQPPAKVILPFQIYQPSSFQPTGLIFDSNANSTVCTINAMLPTNLGGTTPNVNPNTDGWRLWNVRSGLVEYRPLYGFGQGPNGLKTFDGNEGGNYSILIGISNAGYSSPWSPNIYGVDNQPLNSSSTDTNSGGLTIVVDGIPDNGTVNYAIWVQIVPDTAPTDSGTIFPYGVIKGRRFSIPPSGVYGEISFPIDLPTTPLCVPIGLLTGSTSNLSPVQIQVGNAVGRYPVGVLAQRGEWSAGSLSGRVFYPNDIVLDDTEYQEIISGVNFYTTYQYVSLPQVETDAPHVNSGTRWSRFSNVIM